MKMIKIIAALISFLLLFATGIPSSVIAEAGLVGDVNKDEIISSKDTLLLNKFIANWDVIVDINVSDVNVDGTINSKDSLLLRQYIANWDVVLGSTGKENDFAKNPNYNLVWSEEFNGTSLDTNSWGYEIGFIRNNEPQYYTNRTDNVKVEDGNLVITCRREDYTSGTKSAKYTSGSINTQGKHSWKYGAIEMRAKLPVSTCKSTWPAFWMMGINNGWPKCGEVDILEMWGTNFNKYYCTVHWYDEIKRAYAATWQKENGGNKEYDNGSTPLGNDWHTYGVEWDDQQMRFYCDDTTLGIVDITKSTMTELHQPYYLLLNLALTSSDISSAVDSEFPLTYLVDYVKVYQKNS